MFTFFNFYERSSIFLLQKNQELYLTILGFLIFVDFSYIGRLLSPYKSGQSLIDSIVLKADWALSSPYILGQSLIQFADGYFKNFRFTSPYKSGQSLIPLLEGLMDEMFTSPYKSGQSLISKRIDFQRRRFTSPYKSGQSLMFDRISFCSGQVHVPL